MDAAELTRSACRIFGHQWGTPKYRAGKDPFTGKLVIARVRCKRCGERAQVER